MRKFNKAVVFALASALLFAEAAPTRTYAQDAGGFTTTAVTTTTATTTTVDVKDEFVTYTVKAKDTLWGIAERYLGDGRRYNEIYVLNKDKIKNPSLIYAGQVLTLPVKKVKVGAVINGFEVKEISEFDMLGADLVIYEHQKTGAEVLMILNDDTNRMFDITFKTPAADTGVSHVFEHATLGGSKKYPEKSLFFNLSYQTYNTYMNASTYQMMTTYPVASLSEAQLLKYADFYTDSCFNPNITKDKSIFDEEAWRYVLNNEEDALTIAGTVYSEMLGAYNIARAADLNFKQVIFPGSVTGNCSGGNPASIPDLTWQDLIDYHDDYYHPSNSLTVIYGKIENASGFLALLDGYFSEFDKEEIVIADSEYKPIAEAQTASFEYGVEKGTDTANGTYAYYGFVCEGASEEDYYKLDMLTTLINDESSAFKQMIKKQLPKATVGCYVDDSTPEMLVEFYARNIETSEVETFKQIVDDGIATLIKDGFDMDAVDAIIASNKLSILLSSESSSVGENMIPNFAWEWACFDNILGYKEFIDDIDNFKEYVENGALLELAKKYLSENKRTAIVSTYPVAGLKEQQDAALADRLAEVKSKMSKAEIAEVVENTKNFNNPDTAEDTTASIKKLTAVTVSSLPEEARIYDYTDVTGSDGIRRINVEANVTGVGETSVLLDASGLTQEQLLYFQLFTSLIGELDTKSHTTAQLSSLMGRYLYDGTIKVSLLDYDNEREYNPYLRATFTALDEDLSAGYDLIYELVFDTDFSDTEAILGEVSYAKNSVKNTINNSAYLDVIRRFYASADGKDSVNAAYYYINYEDYYAFLCEVEELLATNPKEVQDNLLAIQKNLNNKNNAITGFVGNKDSAKANEKAVNAFLSKLDSVKVEAKAYDFGYKMENFGLIYDGNVNFNVIYATYEDLGVEKPDADFSILMSFMSDRYMLPLLRDQFGAYGAYIVDGGDGVLAYTYRDPNIAETYEVFASIPELAQSFTYLTQDDINGYILSTYSQYALSTGELAGGQSAFFTILAGDDQKDLLEDMKTLKALNPEKAAAYTAIFDKFQDAAYIGTAAGASTINANSAYFDTVYNPFGALDNSQIVLDDVTEGTWFYDYVRYVFENSILAAKSETVFGVGDDATIAEIAVPLYQMIGGDDNADDAIAFFAGYGLFDASVDKAASLTKKEALTYYINFAGLCGVDGSTLTSDYMRASGFREADLKNKATREDISFMLTWLYEF